MEIANLWFTQRSLNRSARIQLLIERINFNDLFTGSPIALQEDDDGQIEIVDGHHRVVASWLAGLTSLRSYDFRCYPKHKNVNRMWQVKDFDRWKCYLNNPLA